MLSCIRKARGQRGSQHMLSDTVKCDDAFFDGPTAGKKRERGTGKAKVLVALLLDSEGHNLRFLKVKTTKDVRRRSIKAKHLDNYLNEFYSCFSRRVFGVKLFQRLSMVVVQLLAGLRDSHII